MALGSGCVSGSSPSLENRKLVIPSLGYPPLEKFPADATRVKCRLTFLFCLFADPPKVSYSLGSVK